MKHSRYIWTMVIVICCLMGVVWWFSPNKVMHALANPNYAFTPRATVQHFWNLLDSRQVELAEELLKDSNNQLLQAEFQGWKNIVESNPLLSLQKIEFLDSIKPEAIVVHVCWSSSLREELSVTYVFNLQKEKSEWVIKDFTRIKDLSYWGNSMWMRSRVQTIQT